MVLRHGKITRSDGLRVAAMALSESAEAKIGIVVPAHVEKTAVGRHKVKRMLREAAMSLIDKLAPSYGYVITVDRRLVEPSSEVMRALLQKLV